MGSLKGIVTNALITQIPGDEVYYYHSDHLGTPQKMTDFIGTVVWEASYLPFGEATVDEDPDGDEEDVTNNLRFPGQYYDAETSLHYNWHRDYHPGIGRYIESDPIGIQGGLNHLYLYAKSNPIRFFDLNGLACSRKCPDCPEGEWEGSASLGVNFLPGGGVTIDKVFWSCKSSSAYCEAGYFCFGGGAIHTEGVTLAEVWKATGAFCKSDLGGWTSVLIECVGPYCYTTTLGGGPRLESHGTGPSAGPGGIAYLTCLTRYLHCSF